MVHFDANNLLSFIENVTLQKLLFVIFKSCLNKNPRKARHQSPRQMSPDIIIATVSQIHDIVREVVAKNEKNAKMKMSPNLPKLATICINVLLS